MSARRLAPLLAALALVAGCDDEPITVVVVTVEGRASVTDIATLEIVAANGEQRIQTSFDVAGRDLPLTFSITPTGRTGDITVTARALDDGGALRGIGSGVGTIVTDGRADVPVLLDPGDFVVNSSIAGNQRLSFFFERNGRQVAGHADGFTVVYVNDCATLGRCDVFGRSFDADGVPATNGITQDAAEFIANLSDEIGSVPAIGIGSKGSLVTWETAADVRGVALDTDGAHVSSIESVISTSDQFPGDGTVVAVANGDYVVAWTEGGGGAVRGRLIGSDGQPRTNGVTGDALDFPVATSPSGTPLRPSLVSTGSGHGFACVWRNGSDVRARFFDMNAAPVSGGEVTLNSFGAGASLVGPHMAWTGSGGLVAWGVRDAGSTTLAGGQFQVQAFAGNGSADGPVRVLALSTPAFPTAPDLASLEDGLVGAVWENCDAAGDGGGCGIFFQLLRPTGLPVGQAIAVNTTTAGDQSDPGIAAVGSDRFAVVWTDASGAPPDTSGSAVRARILFPALDPTDGRLGARCGQPTTDPCDDDLVCMAGSDGVAHCHEQCDPAGPAPACPFGGICTSAGDTSGCLF